IRVGSLNQEEERLKLLMSSERAEQLINLYNQRHEKPWYYAGKGNNKFNIHSKDDLLILIRHTLTKRSSKNVSEEDSEEKADFRARLLAVDTDLFESLELKLPVRQYYPSSILSVIAAFPSFDLKAWEFKVTPLQYWNRENLYSAIKWLFEQQLKIEKKDPQKFRDDIRKTKLFETFNKFKLINGIRQCKYKISAAVIIDTYSELKLHEWEFLKSVRWSGERGRQNVKQAVKWLVEERYGLSPEDPDFKQKIARISKKDFQEAGLSGFLNAPEFRSHLKAIIYTYPDIQIREDELSRVPTGTWQGEEGYKRAIAYIQDMVENKLGLDPGSADFKQSLLRVSVDDFTKNRLRGMIGTLFKSSRREAIKAAYPELFTDEADQVKKVRKKRVIVPRKKVDESTDYIDGADQWLNEMLKES
ncbi:hypothetical protein HYT02_01360, partial [Candidatus Gottesmanbacteria bacterium]|nr:hypothetical protein [Candidatus Gottesmanbacteria bacterium]